MIPYLAIALGVAVIVLFYKVAELDEDLNGITGAVAGVLVFLFWYNVTAGTIPYLILSAALMYGLLTLYKVAFGASP